MSKKVKYNGPSQRNLVTECFYELLDTLDEGWVLILDGNKEEYKVRSSFIEYATQIGGKHYGKNDPIQFARDNYPAEQLEGFFRINVDKYVARYDKKNGLEDLKKAKHYLDMLIELKESDNDR